MYGRGERMWLYRYSDLRASTTADEARRMEADLAGCDGSPLISIDLPAGRKHSLHRACRGC